MVWQESKITMTSSTLRLYSDHRGYLSTSKTKPGRYELSPRSRSRAIAINSSRETESKSREQILEETRKSEAAAEYDWATWRMYNRIIEHRRKHPVTYLPEEEEEEREPVEGGEYSTKGDRSTSTENLRPTSLLSTGTSKSTEDLHEDHGEIFELDL